MYGAEIDFCCRILRALYLCYMILLIPAHSGPSDSGARVGAVPASVLLLAKFQYSSVRSAQKSGKLPKKNKNEAAQTQTGVASRLCGRWKQHKLKEKIGAAVSSIQEKSLFLRHFHEADASCKR